MAGCMTSTHILAARGSRLGWTFDYEGKDTLVLTRGLVEVTVWFDARERVQHAVCIVGGRATDRLTGRDRDKFARVSAWLEAPDVELIPTGDAFDIYVDDRFVRRVATLRGTRVVYARMVRDELARGAQCVAWYRVDSTTPVPDVGERLAEWRVRA